MQQFSRGLVALQKIGHVLQLPASAAWAHRQGGDYGLGRGADLAHRPFRQGHGILPLLLFADAEIKPADSKSDCLSWQQWIRLIIGTGYNDALRSKTL